MVKKEKNMDFHEFCWLEAIRWATWQSVLLIKRKYEEVSFQTLPAFFADFGVHRAWRVLGNIFSLTDYQKLVLLYFIQVNRKRINPGFLTLSHFPAALALEPTKYEMLFIIRSNKSDSIKCIWINWLLTLCGIWSKCKIYYKWTNLQIPVDLCINNKFRLFLIICS